MNDDSNYIHTLGGNIINTLSALLLVCKYWSGNLSSRYSVLMFMFKGVSGLMKARRDYSSKT